MLVVICFVVFLWFPPIYGSNSVVLMTMSNMFGKVLYKCMDELRLGQNVLNDFLSYWKPNKMFVNKQDGCAARCVLKKLNLLLNNGTLSTTRAEAFVKTAGGDDGMAKYVVYLYQSCEKVATAKEPCMKVLEVTNCFRTAVQRAQWSKDTPVEIKKKSDG